MAVFIHLQPVKHVATVLVTVVAEWRNIVIFRNKKYQRELAPFQEGTLCKGCAFYDTPFACIGIIREALPTSDNPEECLCVGKKGNHYIFVEENKCTISG